MIFFISGIEYNPTSIDLVKKFIIDCKMALGNNPFLYFAFQTNSLNDYCYSSELFKEEFEKNDKIFGRRSQFLFPQTLYEYEKLEGGDRSGKNCEN